MSWFVRCVPWRFEEAVEVTAAPYTVTRIYLGVSGRSAVGMLACALMSMCPLRIDEIALRAAVIPTDASAILAGLRCRLFAEIGPLGTTRRE
jgi:hypothetical protein